MTESMTLKEWAARLNRNSINLTDLVAYGVGCGAEAICCYRRKGTWKVSIKGATHPVDRFEKVQQRYEKD